MEIHEYLTIGFDAERLGLNECVCCAIYTYIAKLQIKPTVQKLHCLVFVHNFSLPLFAPISIYKLFSSTCTIV
jgi:hypothetical protein